MAISLNEAFRYQNFLTSIRTELVDCLSNSDFTITRTLEHYRSKAAPGLEDETVRCNAYEEKVGFSPNAAIKLLSDVSKERERLSAAVFAAKSTLKLSAGIGVDEAVMLNKERRTIADTFKQLAFLKPTPQQLRQGEGRAYKFTESEKTGAHQVSISYDILLKSAINYDRNIVKSEYKRLLKEADSVSSEIDEVFSKRIVDFEAAYDVQSTVADIIENMSA